MSRALRFLLLAAFLTLGLPASAFDCVAQIAYDYVVREDLSAPPQSEPCCARTARPAALDKDGPLAHRGGEPIPGLRVDAGPSPVASLDLASPDRGCAYARRSRRLLR